jgi:hypothetical protein
METVGVETGEERRAVVVVVAVSPAMGESRLEVGVVLMLLPPPMIGESLCSVEEEEELLLFTPI